MWSCCKHLGSCWSSWKCRIRCLRNRFVNYWNICLRFICSCDIWSWYCFGLLNWKIRWSRSWFLSRIFYNFTWWCSFNSWLYSFNRWCFCYNNSSGRFFNLILWCRVIYGRKISVSLCTSSNYFWCCSGSKF